MDDLVRWLGAQLDEDERIARGACWDDQSDVWTARPPQGTYKQYERYTVVDYLDDGVVAVTPENADDDGVGQHIAEWDPARVLREIDAKRSLVAAYADALTVGPDVNGGYTRPIREAFARQARNFLIVLAMPYSDRPGFAEAIATVE